MWDLRDIINGYKCGVGVAAAAVGGGKMDVVDESENLKP